MRKTLTGCLALLGEDAVASDGPVDIVIDGDRIAAIRPHGGAAAEGERIDAAGLLVAPGLINGHHHSHEGFYKGRKDNLPLELWMNYVRPLKPIELTPREIYLRTMVGAIEAVRSGTTMILDDTNQSPTIRPEQVEQIYQAYEDLGIRAGVGITLFDRPFFRAVPFVEEEFPPDLLARLDATPRSSADELLAYVRGLAETRHPRTSRVGTILAPSAPQRCTEPFLRSVRQLADELDLPVIIHVQETRMQVVTGQLWYGCSMFEYLDRIGFLKPMTQVIHGVWLAPRDIEILARTEVTVQHNPTSNLKVGSGLAPIRALLDAGVNVSMGTDGCGSIEGTDMQNALYLAALLHKLRGEHTGWIGAPEAFRFATIGGARALGRENELGALTPGRLADLVGYRLDRIAFTPLNNPLNQLVYAAGQQTIDLVMVGGDIVQRGGHLTRVDEGALLAEIAAAHIRIAPELAASEASVEELLPPYQRIFQRCKCMPVAEDIYPARFSQ